MVREFVKKQYEVDMAPAPAPYPNQDMLKPAALRSRPNRALHAE